MIALLAISLGCTLAYLCLSAAASGGIPVSLSATYYTLGKKGWLFQTALWTVSFTLLPVWIKTASDRYGWMAFLSCASLAFVASAPCFRMKLEGTVHYISAAVCCVCAVGWQIVEGVWDSLLLFGMPGLMLTLRDRSKWCWWTECAVIGSLYASLIREWIV